ncbi:MAG: transcriptional regulator [Candidatus Fluviicola riflensis]|nr:MAG: transcriptional regulator [Candidatus Fluviicola riflensis]OGS77629.1 MAG: transcriptional regulator [Candidatus Fluviicola riflensis]OGS84212.1 MAG: transcriptional regulator [Fluviicola sp. RIFCSPHIGHO2_12_FULL_43_24]OGS84695.1 MAG: transcriptional regulator [Fluviicola sp. RIFCSPHIGHO2_01_FULL_43_53]
MELRRDVFQAIADPTRRGIIDLLGNQAMNLNAISGHFDISRPAISKHIKILTECGLITIKQTGRERYCSTDFQKLKEIDDWLNHHRKFWNRKLDALGDFLERPDETDPSQQAKSKND